MGAGPVEVGIVAQELGRVIAPEPLLTSVVLAGGLVAAAGHRRAEEGAARRPLRRRDGARLRARRARRPLGPRCRRGDGVRRRDAHRRQGAGARTAPAPTCSSSAPLPRRGTGLFLVEPGDGVERDRLRHPRRRPRRPGRVRRPQRDPARRRPVDATAGARARVAAAKIADCHEALGAMEVGAEADHGLPHHPQAVRRDRSTASRR